MSLQQAVALCWRVKRWKLDFLIEVEGQISFPQQIPDSDPPQFVMVTGEIFNESASYSGELKIQENLFEYTEREAHSGKFVGQSTGKVATIETETELMCAGDNAYYLSAFPTQSLTVNGPRQVALRFSLAQIVDELLGARFGFFASASNNSLFSFGGLSFRTGYDLRPQSQESHLKGELKFLNHSLPLYFFSEDGGAANVPLPVLAGPTLSYVKATNFRFILEPSAYWEYDPGDGRGPIYDEETGEVLRGFPD